MLKAENDFAAAQRLIRQEPDESPLPDIVCFHCQQCVEKYLKAYLQEHDLRFRLTHPLLPLLELCLSIDPEFEQQREDLTRLEGYSVAVRYPGVEVTFELAERALAAAGRVRSFIRTKLEIDNPPALKGDEE
jgi:HEPN domain-containing protein